MSGQLMPFATLHLLHILRISAGRHGLGDEAQKVPGVD